MVSLQDLTKRKLEREAHTALGHIINVDPSDTHKGAVIRLFHLSHHSDGMAGLTELWSAWIGGNARSNIERRPKYEALSYEKALRTALNHYMHSHVSSYESVRPKVHQYQGAVLIGAYIKDIHATEPTLLIASVSGLSALNDQRLALFTNERMGWASPVSIVKVCAVTGDHEYMEGVSTFVSNRR